MKKSVEITTRQAKNMLSCAYENAMSIVRKNAADYIRLNPQDEERRNHELLIESVGISNLYFKMLNEIERAEKITLYGRG